jgi:uncharacterized protein YhhL (DUF1145 family)
MTLLQQLMWGSLFLCLCLILESVLLVWCMSALRRAGNILKSLAGPLRNGALLLVSLGFILLAHSAQIWIWAAAFVASGTLPDWNTSVYYSLITYTTLGYGDVVLGPGLRIFGGFAAINGVLGFGISTAFLVAVMGQALRETGVLRRPDGQD